MNINQNNIEKTEKEKTKKNDSLLKKAEVLKFSEESTL